MDVRGLLVIVRDVATLALGVGGVIHEEFYTTTERPVLLGLYAACLVGLATVQGRKLVRALSRMAAEDDDQTSTSPTSGQQPSSPPRSPV